jgi:hypothetical protein
LAVGYGSFGLLVYLLSPNLETLYIPSYLEHDSFLYQFDWSRHGLTRLVSVPLDDYKAKMGNKWRNEHSQRQLMLQYRLKYSFERPVHHQPSLVDEATLNHLFGLPGKRSSKKETVFSTAMLLKRKGPSGPKLAERDRQPIVRSPATKGHQDGQPLIIHYCCAKYPESYGGVPRFDHHVCQAFPTRRFVKGGNRASLLRTIDRNQKTVVITDNHLSIDVPLDIPTVIVHHGVAKANIERNPELKRSRVYQNISSGQEQMLKIRRPENTLIMSCSQYCMDLFQQYYGAIYEPFPKRLLWHSTEMDPTVHRQKLNQEPVILGNFSTGNKGNSSLEELKRLLPEFRLISIHTSRQKDIAAHNREVAEIYLRADLFLQLSGSEGFGYATLDAFNKNLLICGTDVGLLYDLRNEDIGIIFPHQKRTDLSYVAERIRELWSQRDRYFGKSKEWHDRHINFDQWQSSFRQIVTSFLEENYGSCP